MTTPKFKNAVMNYVESGGDELSVHAIKLADGTGRSCVRVSVDNDPLNAAYLHSLDDVNELIDQLRLAGRLAFVRTLKA